MYSKNIIEETLYKFQIEESDLKRIRAAGKILAPEIDDHVAAFYTWQKKHKEHDLFFAANPSLLKRVVALQKKHWLTFLEANIDESWFLDRMHVGAVHAHINLANDIYFAGMSFCGISLVERIKKAGNLIKNPDETAASITKLIFLDSYVVIEEIARIHRVKMTASTQAMLELSTPITPIWDGILLLPLLGIIDSTRTQDVMNKSLTEISKTRAKVFVLDISGVSSMDTAVSNQLLKISRATLLMGCETIISGISPSIARTLVELGIDVGQIKTTSTLRDAFELALKAIGIDKNSLSESRS